MNFNRGVAQCYTVYLIEIQHGTSYHPLKLTKSIKKNLKNNHIGNTFMQVIFLNSIVKNSRDYILCETQGNSVLMKFKKSKLLEYLQ